MEPATAIPDAVPATAAALARAGITTAGRVRAMGADAGYGALLGAGGRPHGIGDDVLVMGLQGRPRNDAAGPEKAALRARFRAIKAAHAGAGAPAGIERILDAIGLVLGGGR